jgi:hypothetical protein
MSRWKLLPICVSILVIGAAAAQSKTDFSGQWSLVAAPGMGGGSGRGGRGGGGAVTSIISGAPVNCGRECTMTQDVRTLTISRPANQQGIKPPDVVLNLDGRESTIIQSLEPPVEYKAGAKWDGGKLVVIRSMGKDNVTQTISIQDDKLTVVSLFNVEGAVPVTLTYAKK